MYTGPGGGAYTGAGGGMYTGRWRRCILVLSGGMYTGPGGYTLVRAVECALESWRREYGTWRRGMCLQIKRRNVWDLDDFLRNSSMFVLVGRWSNQEASIFCP
jgi:hypothetical protein